MTNPIHDIYTSGEADAADRIPLRSRIPALTQVGVTAVSALIVCSPLLFAARPKTPLRVLCIAAFEYLARLRGGTLDRRRRLAMAHACDFGSLRDDYYDHRKLDAAEYRLLRCSLRRAAPEAATLRYIRQLRQAERSRPTLAANTPGIENAVIVYRTGVLELSLFWLHAIAGLCVEPARLHALLDVACLFQLADDLLDWKEDQALRCPTYVTAFLLDRPRSDIGIPLRAQADAFLQRTIAAARQDTGIVPLAAAAVLAWTFIIPLLRLRFPR